MCREVMDIKERPILFSGPMVRAILEGRKTQTRRVIKPNPDNLFQSRTKSHGFGHGHDGVGWYFSDYEYAEEGTTKWNCPYGQPGDRLWVRETWTGADDPAHKHAVLYRADGERAARWRSSIHMFRWASRITLEITNVRVERVRDISELDSVAEGMDLTPEFEKSKKGHPLAPYKTCFAWRWNLHNEKRGFGWLYNPWVWVIEFKRVENAS